MVESPPFGAVRVAGARGGLHEGSALLEQLRLLLDLQEVDEAIAEARLKQRKLPDLVAKELAAFTEAEEALKEAEQTLADLETSRRDKEGQLEEQEAHMQRLKGHLKEITNTREYQAYIQEMDGVQRTVGQLEEEILGILADIDGIREQVAERRKDFDAHRQIYETERAKVDEELARIEKDVEAAQAAKAERSAKIQPALLKRYDKINAQMRRALVAVESYSCGGCHMNVPPQLVSEVKRANQIHQCPHCHRLLFVPERVEEATGARN
jgi:predicted  nucleic acid-binding Zn-ribbon protein